ncbi:hypothetical protein PC116_g4801 [Phytophthora cactorum]|uniref:Uncharacterized protein n=1 Tax=Phytophthora cactorum TaxID=29920 RepID=A0A8T1LE64_9STRA|nr:hypothetical protein PC113_g1818 [Phytophthora cactorum]KAG3190291.1 hypothetical protein C6341_g1759 [Phytophthora cactorum]KAG4247393.1 hypothetical protein PC116_g4801 [Phytophthora cactorum]
MDLRTRGAHKRPLSTPPVFEGESTEESTEAASTEALESTSSASESGGAYHVVAPSPQKLQFSSWKALEDYLTVYQGQTFQVFPSRSNTTATERKIRIVKK